MKIAVVGAGTYDAVKLEAFLLALHQKYPHATIVTGNGRGAEKAVKTQMEAWGHTVELPLLRNDLYGASALDCQINDILSDAPIIVVVGTATGSRPKIARDIYARMNNHREPHNRQLIHFVADNTAKAKKAPPKKARTRKQKEASLL